MVRWTKSQKVEIGRRTVLHIEPEVKEKRPLQQKLVFVWRDAQSIQHSLEGVAGQRQVEIALLCPCLVEQTRANGLSEISLVLVRLSR